MDRIVDQLAPCADSLTFEKIPSPVIQQAKRLVIDALGCAMGGSRQPTIQDCADGGHRNDRALEDHGAGYGAKDFDGFGKGEEFGEIC